ncbi:hypothetical protein NB814_01045 [Latilactobacillus curvatus]|uniref:hypothetical protein n=1 Tax=Latilactobacillus curvatus TaxID=28038 RepID=UPI00202DEF2A|nr:hypothetical protein [Latilactobacillus curvatus]MCM0724340.1 hypothetical protein [Latilactobacillus curvatus]
MNKNLYMTCISSIILGLCIPNFMQFPVTLLIIGSFATYVGLNHKEFFGTKKADSADDTDDQVN